MDGGSGVSKKIEEVNYQEEEREERVCTGGQWRAEVDRAKGKSTRVFAAE